MVQKITKFSRDKTPNQPSIIHLTDLDPKNNKENKADNLLSVYSVIYNIVNSRKDKDRALEKQMVQGIARYRKTSKNKKNIKKQEKHQKTITDHDNETQTIQYENFVLETQKDVQLAQLQRCQDHVHDLITNHCIPCPNDPGKDIVMIIVKITIP